ncbi:MAG: dihydroxy-acid dehydratase, partial [Betaproteobacteria bacterium]|nr:dihydroxy-acid dehydratase [Betaproteobacteria bacterium]
MRWLLLAIGGSTNALIHLTAIAAGSASRCRWTSSTRSSARCRCWSTSKPSGQHYMEHLPRGGRPVGGAARARAVAASTCLRCPAGRWARASPRSGAGLTAGCYLRRHWASRRSAVAGPCCSACAPARSGPRRRIRRPTPGVRRSTGRAVVFRVARGPRRTHRPRRTWTPCPDDFLVLQRTPARLGAAGMPGGKGTCRSPRSWARQASRTWSGISDARMSGTAFG